MINISYKKNNKGKPELRCVSDGKEIYFSEKSKVDFEIYDRYIKYLNDKFRDKTLKTGKEFKEFVNAHVDEYLEYIGENW